jgi:hypothetical protein
MQVLRLPSAEVTLQDTFTDHFRQPAVADPWWLLVRLAYRLWTNWLTEQAAAPLFLVLALVGVWALRRNVALSWLALALAATGVAQVTAHPLVSEADRLGALMWTPVVLGIPLAIDQLRERRRWLADTADGSASWRRQSGSEVPAAFPD